MSRTILDHIYKFWIERAALLERRYFFRKYVDQIKAGEGFRSDRGFEIRMDSDNCRFRAGKNVSFRKNCTILLMESGQLSIGDNVFFNNACSINCIHGIHVGDNTLFGEGVKLYDHNHVYSRQDGLLQVQREDFNSKEIMIGKNCWLGSEVVVLSGVEIGDNCIIGAHQLIYKSVPPNSIIVSSATAVYR